MTLNFNAEARQSLSLGLETKSHFCSVNRSYPLKERTPKEADVQSKGENDLLFP